MKITHTLVETAPIVLINRSSGSPRVIIGGDNALVAFDLSPSEALKVADAIYHECGKTSPAVDNGWIPWDGGERPVPSDTQVEYRMRSGGNYADSAGTLRWNHRGEMWRGDIIAYRVVKP